MATRHPGALREAVHWLETEIPSRNQLLASIDCPFSLLLNPHLADVEESSLLWLDRLGLTPTLKQRTRVRKAHLSTLVAGFYPTAGREELQLASDYVCWAFALDDLGDETAVGERPARLLELFEGFEQLLLGGIPGSAASALDRGLFDIVQRVSKFTNAAHIADFLEGNRSYFGGMLWEANNRAHAQVPDESAYLTFRPAAGAVPSFFALIEPLEQITLPPRARVLPEVQNLVRLTGSIICWINDLLSYEKERAHGDFHNLVMVYEHHRRLPPSIAAAQAIQHINAAIADFCTGAARLPRFGPAEGEQVQRYLDTLRAVMRVTLDWTYDSTRYHEASGRR